MRTPGGRSLLVVFATLVAACESRTRSSRAPRSACGAFPDDSSYRVAALEYIEGLEPKPRRFLTAVGTDSVLPDPVFAALQQKGPSYLFPEKPEDQAKVLEKLTTVGPWSTLLVTWRGSQLIDGERAVIRLGGQYIIAEPGPLAAPRRAIHFECASGKWSYTRTQEEKAT